MSRRVVEEHGFNSPVDADHWRAHTPSPCKSQLYWALISAENLPDLEVNLSKLNYQAVIYKKGYAFTARWRGRLIAEEFNAGHC